MKKTILLVTLFVFIIVMLPGCSLLQKLGLQGSQDDELRPVSSIVIGETEASKLTDKTPLRLYFANADNTKLKLEIRYVGTAEVKKSDVTLATAVMNELIKGPSDNTAFKSTIPAETKLVSPIQIENKVATVNLSKEFKTKHPGGKEAERMTIYSIVNSLTELEGIEKVKFTIDGKSQKEYMGNFKFDALFPRSTQLIGKDASGSGADATEGGADSGNVQAPAAGSPSGGDSKETSGPNGETMDGLELLE
jgi:hypothetical protein